MSFPAFLQDAINMSDGLIKVLDHSIRSLIGGFRGYAKFLLGLWRHRQVKIDGLAYLL
jgi:hypothetical protein